MTTADSNCRFPGCVNKRHGAEYCTGHERQRWLGRPLTPLRIHNRVVDGRKKCGRCGVTKSVDEFGRKLHYVTEMCRVCRGIGLRASTYGLSWDETARLLESGCCDVCGLKPDTLKELHIDHCHESDRVRGVLCNGCNTAIGLTREDPAVLRKLADYVESHRQ